MSNKKTAYKSGVLILGATLLLSSALAQENSLNPTQERTIDPLLSTEPVPVASKPSRVTAVYGITADDYMPSVKQLARQKLRPGVRNTSTRPQFNLPDIFYYVAGPIFLALFIRVLVIFLNMFEEMRKEEIRKAMIETHKLEQT